MNYIVQASPLTKIFLVEWAQECAEDPTKIDPELHGKPRIDFEVLIPRPTGGIKLQHMKPVHTSTLIPRFQTFQEQGRAVKRTTREVEEDEITPLVYWLTGGPEGHKCDETDIYGCVLVDVDNHFEQGLQELMAMSMEATTDDEREKMLKAQLSKQKKLAKSMGDSLVDARRKADERVKRALSITHNNLIKSWETLKGEGKGQYAPSTQEALGYYIMKKEIDRRTEINRRLYNQVADGIPGAQRA